jgi:hypothetical protein
MNALAQVVWDGLEFRKPAMLRILDAMTHEQMMWRPPNQANPSRGSCGTSRKSKTTGCARPSTASRGASRSAAV